MYVQIQVNLEQFLATCMCRIRVSYWGEKEVCIRIRGNFWRLPVQGSISACPFRQLRSAQNIMSAVKNINSRPRKGKEPEREEEEDID